SERRRPHVLRHQASHAPVRNAAASGIAEERVVASRGITLPPTLADGQVSIEGEPRLASEEDDPLLAPLAEDLRRARAKVQRREVEARHLRASAACRVEELENG